MDRKTVSVVIPTYNRGYCIKRSIESVINQTYPVSEIIVVDDGSTDNTKEIVESIKDNRIKYYMTEENRGAGAARNYGVSGADSEYIAFHDSDDICFENRIELEMAKMEECEEVGLVYGAHLVQTSETEGYIVPDYRVSSGLEGDIYRKLLVKNTIGAPTILIKKEMFELVGGFDETMSSLEDWDFAIRVAKECRIGFVPEVLIKVEYQADGLSSKSFDYYQNRCYMLKKYLNEVISLNMLDKVLKSIIEKAQQSGMTDTVERLLEIYLS